MRLHPVSISLMVMKGAKALRRRKLWSKRSALASLKGLTGQDFGYDAKKWGEWLRKNRWIYYR